MRMIRFAVAAAMPLWLAACATQMPLSATDAPLPAQWNAPLPASVAVVPHNGTVTDLSQWWRTQGDPLLAQLIESAQSVSPTIASARSRIEQSRATRVAAGAALLPALNGTGSISRTSTQPPLPMGTTVQAALQPSWEIDIFGANRNARDAAQARFEGAQAGWHEARVAVAAEVANQYYSLRSCEKLLGIVNADAKSRAETARLTQLSAEAGFQAPATAALARASAAEGNSRAIQQRAQCDIDIKALVALSGMPERELRQQAAATAGELPQTMAMSVAALPAHALTQRPEIFSAAREVAAASAEVGTAQAQRYPQLTLSGSVGLASFRAGGVSTDLNTWSIGPLALTVPLFDGGRRAANVEAAQARYDEAATNYRAVVRQAVREVEEALVTLDSTAARSQDAATAVEGYRTSFASTESRYVNGFASLVELEEARRTRLAAETALANLQRERVAAWIALYRAAGGGWTGSGTTAVSAQAN